MKLLQHAPGRSGAFPRLLSLFLLLSLSLITLGPSASASSGSYTAYDDDPGTMESYLGTKIQVVQVSIPESGDEITVTFSEAIKMKTKNSGSLTGTTFSEPTVFVSFSADGYTWRAFDPEPSSGNAPDTDWTFTVKADITTPEKIYQGAEVSEFAGTAFQVIFNKEGNGDEAFFSVTRSESDLDVNQATLATEAGVTEASSGNITIAAFPNPFTWTNNSKQLGPPQVSDAALDSTGTEITVTFDQPVRPAGDDLSGGIWDWQIGSVSVATTGNPLNSTNGTGLDTSWTFTLSQFVRQNQTVEAASIDDTLSYFENANGQVLDTPYNGEITTGSFGTFSSANAPADTSAPTIESATLSEDGTLITVKFSEEMRQDTTVSGFTVFEGATSVGYDSVSNLDAYGDEVVITLSEPSSSSSLTLDYDDAGSLSDVTFKTLASVSDIPVLVSQTSSPAPYAGPLISGISEGPGATFNSSGTDTVTFEGERLGTVTTASINGIEAEVLSTSNDEFEVSIPEGLEPGTYDLLIESSLGNLTYLDAITITGSTVSNESGFGEVTAWTTRISDTQAKVYVKYPTVGEKVRISHQTGGSGSYETVYVKTTASEDDPSMIVNEHGSYIVRTIDLENINRIRVTVGDQRLVQVRYNQ